MRFPLLSILRRAVSFTACVALATTHPAADLRRCPGADLVLASLGDLTAAMLQSLIGTAEEAAL